MTNECTGILNVDSGGGDRVAQICAYLDAQQADVIVLTEWRDTDPGKTIAAWARASGLRERMVGTLVAANRERVVIAREDPRVGRVDLHFPRAGYIAGPA